MQRHDFAYDLPPELIAQTPLSERSASRLLVLEGTAPRTSTAASACAAIAPAAGAASAHAASAGIGATGVGAGSAIVARVTAARTADTATIAAIASAIGGGARSATGKQTGHDSPAVTVRDCTMRDFPTVLRPGDLLVFNDTKVVAARLVGTKPSGGRVEVFLERVVAEAESEALVQLRSSKPVRDGLEVTTAGGIVRIIGRQDDLWRVGLPGPALEFFEKWGDVPLPPYIHRTPDANDRERYQSIFARERGAVAAPTASLHFDTELIRSIEKMGVTRAFVTLHVGAGTFQPVRMDDLDTHVMHSERVSVSSATCSVIEKTRAAGGRVIAIGTTVIRALESAARAASLAPSLAPSASDTAPAASPAAGAWIGEATALPGGAPAARGDDAPTALADSDIIATPAKGASRPVLPLAGWTGETRLFIRPGFQFQVADALLTNFHLPESTLLMLVCAFAGMQPVLAAYEHAVREKYRFFSYGDAMFLTRTPG